MAAHHKLGKIPAVWITEAWHYILSHVMAYNYVHQVKMADLLCEESANDHVDL